MTLRSFTVAFSLALAFAGLPACGSGSSGIFPPSQRGSQQKVRWVWASMSPGIAV